jgi:cytochrome c oxidase subunit 2
MVYLGSPTSGCCQWSQRSGATIDQLFNLHFLVIAFLFSLIVVFMAYSLIVFRKKEGDNAEGKFIKGNNRLEVIWTIIPLGIVIYFSYLGSVSLAETQRVDPQAMEVKVVGGQWFWRFEYPEYGITSDKLVLPVDEQVLLRMTSLDVIHSFWVPEFRVKQDLLPGETSNVNCALPRR